MKKIELIVDLNQSIFLRITATSFYEDKIFIIYHIYNSI